LLIIYFPRLAGRRKTKIDTTEDGRNKDVFKKGVFSYTTP
jgi:hypothetical protein